MNEPFTAAWLGQLATYLEGKGLLSEFVTFDDLSVAAHVHVAASLDDDFSYHLARNVSEDDSLKSGRRVVLTLRGILAVEDPHKSRSKYFHGRSKTVAHVGDAIADDIGDRRAIEAFDDVHVRPTEAALVAKTASIKGHVTVSVDGGSYVTDGVRRAAFCLNIQAGLAPAKLTRLVEFLSDLTKDEPSNEPAKETP